MNNFVFLDNASTTELSNEAKQYLINNLDNYGNPAVLYSFGSDNKKIIREVSDYISEYLCCNSDEIYYTSGASESNSQAIYSAYLNAKKNNLGNNIVVSAIEHHSIINALNTLESEYNVDVTYVGVDKMGMIDLLDLERAINDNTFLTIVMTANNEIGTLQDILNIGNIAHKNGSLFLTDATQAFCKIKLGSIISSVDYLSASSHKFHGPKGVGILYAKNNVPVYPIIHGTQQQSKRGGTENALLVGAMGQAIYQANLHMEEWNSYIKNLMNHLRLRILNEIPNVHENGHPINRLSGILNISFDGIRGEELVILLDIYRVYVSTGSACNSNSGEPSHVLLAMNLTEDQANSSIRFSLSHYNTIEEIDYAVDKLKDAVNRLRGN